LAVAFQLVAYVSFLEGTDKGNKSHFDAYVKIHEKITVHYNIEAIQTSTLYCSSFVFMLKDDGKV